MSNAGYSYCGDPESAGTIIVNTCAFIEPAVEESLDTILDISAEYPMLPSWSPDVCPCGTRKT